MLSSLAITGTALLCGGGSAPPAYHAFAAINDPLSHGQIGDNFLSLNETIQLHNNTLLLNQLSAAEQAQIQLIPGTGLSTYLSWARLDASLTPTITIEQDLDVIIDTTYGLYFSSDNGQTVLDFSGAGIQYGMRSTSNALQMRDLVFSGGTAGLDIVQTDISGQIGLAVNNCRFENLSSFGVRIVSTTANGLGKCYLEDCVFENCAVGVSWDGTAAGRTSFFDLHNCRITGGLDGIEIDLGAGGLGRYTLDRVVIEAAADGIALTRPNGADRTAQLFATHVEVRAPLCVDVEASPSASTTLQIRMAHLWSTASGHALTLGNAGDDVSGIVEDSTFDGDLALGTGGGTMPLTVQNVRCRDGLIDLATTSSQALSCLDSDFQLCGVHVAGSGPATFTNCCFDNTTVTATPTSPTLCLGSFVPNHGPNVTVTGPVPTAQIGGMQVLPDVPTIGSTVTFQADLPAGFSGVFLLGFTDPNAQLIWPQPLHVYGQVNNTFLVPGIVRQQQTFLWTIPPWPIYLGLDLVAQIAVLPDPGVSALPVQLAPGRRFALQ